MNIDSKTSIEQENLSEPIDFEQLVDLGIHKPARYMGQELGIKTHNWHSSKVRWALTYPEIYEVGASNLGHIILYSILNTLPGQFCDRAYLPGADLAKRLRQHKQPLFAVESRRPLYAFDILGFSLSYELGATNILEMISLAGIPLYSKDRANHELSHPDSPPLIFAGGPTATSNPEPYADFFDFVALGDGEELLPEIGLVVSESKTANISRSALLRDLSEIPGVYVPSLYHQVSGLGAVEPLASSAPKRILRRVATPMPHYSMGLVPNIETIHDRLTIEIRRGCTRGCRFCQPGMLTRPARDVDPQEVISAVELGMQKTGYSDFSLLSLSCSDYLALPAVGVELRNRLAKENITLQLPSQRIDRFDDEIAHILGGARQAGLTFAPEAGTQKLRNIVNKGLTDEDLLNGIRKAMENGYRKIKLYFMIGLPGETDEDVLAIATTCKNLQEKCRDLGRLKLNVTISNFTPKPHTPFQWHSVSKAEFEHRQKILRAALKALQGVKGNFTDLRISAMEDFVGRGDRNLAPVIEAAWRAGAGMDAWFECLEQTYEAWINAISTFGLKDKFRELEIGSWDLVQSLRKDELLQFCAKPLPWDHIDTGIEKDWLAHDLQNALNQEVIPDCSFDSCSQCGVCGPVLGQNVIVRPSLPPTQLPKEAPPSNKACRIRLRFSKTKPMHLISHLDLVRLFERAMRRSKLPFSYTGGFHPLPRLQIALALPLGVEALGEWMDIDFYETIEAEYMRKKLQKALPNGIELIKAIEVSINNCNLSKELAEAIWSFDLNAISQHKPNSLDWKNALCSVMQAKQLIWHDTDKKGRPRQRDFKPQLKSLQLKNKVMQGMEFAPITSARVELNTLIDPMGRGLKPIQIQHWVEEYFGYSLEISRVKRNELLLLNAKVL